MGITAPADASGGVVSEMRYYPYGATRSGSVPTDRRYTGQREDTYTQLYDYNARYYDGELGRFIQADTIVPNPGNPQALNRYAYTLGNPLRYIDPSGHYSEDEIMESFGVDTWEQVLAIFESGNLTGLWGWLEVLRQAENKYFVSSEMNLRFTPPSRSTGWAWGDPYNGGFFSRDAYGQILVNGQSNVGFAVAHQEVYSLWQRDPGATGYWNWRYCTASGTKHYHYGYDLTQVDWLDAGMDVAGIAADLLSVGTVGRGMNVAQAADGFGRALDVVGMGYTQYSGASDGEMSRADQADLALAALGAVIPVGPDAVSLLWNLSGGVYRTP